jgi:hypothetical protein
MPKSYKYIDPNKHITEAVWFFGGYLGGTPK